MKTWSKIYLMTILLCSSLTAQKEWVLQPWMQVVGYSGQNLGSSVGFVGKVGDSTQISVSDVHGIQMYRIKSPSDTVPRFVFPGGNSLLGDFNGDGIKDLVVGGNPTKIYLGKAPGVFDTIPFFQYPVGNKVAIGKINGDIYDDLIIGDAGYNGDYRGRVYLFYGGTTMDTVPATILNGESAFRYFGWNVASGDLNNDGFDDIIIRGYDANGQIDSLRYCYIKIFLGGNTIDTNAWKYFKGKNVSATGLASFDVNGDGIDDLLWSNADPLSTIYIHYGKSNLDSVPNLKLNFSGASLENISNGGDLNGDGYNDILTSENGEDQAGNTYVFIYSGGPKMDAHFDAAVGMGGDSNFGTLGRVVSIGDINNDGCADLLIGAPSYQWGTNQGYFGIFLGSKNIPVAGVKESGNISPKTFELLQNYPNPFNPATVISYQLSVNSHVTLKIYDVLGKEIMKLVNKEQGAGNYTIRFDGSKLPSGVYYYTLITTDTHGNNQSETKQMTLVK
jgi:hypothetical protein